MKDSTNHWRVKANAALVLEMIQGKYKVTEASRFFDVLPQISRNGSTNPRRLWRTSTS